MNDTGYREVTLQSRSGQLLCGLVLVICLVTEIGLLAAGEPLTALRSLPPLALLGFGGWVLFWHPAVRVGPATVELRNLLRTVIVNWPAIQDIDSRWTLTLVTARGRHSSWIAARQNRSMARLGARSRALRGARPGVSPERGGIRSGELDLASSSGAAAATALVTAQWNRYRDEGLLSAVEGDGVAIRWHWATIATLLVLVASCVAVANIR